MVNTPSTMVPLGTPAPDFSLPDTDGRNVSLSDFSEYQALLVMFICNHCPFVHHIRKRLTELAPGWQKKGVAVVAINANDAEHYPDDSPERMVQEVKTFGYTFPYLFDETQAVARAYYAACTPDFFLFDSRRRLAYRGQFDSSRPGNSLPVTGKDLDEAVQAVLAGKAVPEPHRPSMGCNIKWKKGNEPGY